MQDNNEHDDRLNIIEKKLLVFEETVNKKIEKLYKYKTVQLTLKVLILSSLSVLIFFRSGKNRDISLWIAGIYVLFVSVLELIELEELRFFLKESDKESERK